MLQNYFSEKGKTQHSMAHRRSQASKPESFMKMFSIEAIGIHNKNVESIKRGCNAEIKKLAKLKASFRKRTIRKEVGHPKNFAHLSHLGISDVGNISGYQATCAAEVEVLGEQISNGQMSRILSRQSTFRPFSFTNGENTFSEKASYGYQFAKSLKVTKLESQLDAYYKEKRTSTLSNNSNREGLSFFNSELMNQLDSDSTLSQPAKNRVKRKSVPVYIASASGDVLLLVKPREDAEAKMERNINEAKDKSEALNEINDKNNRSSEPLRELGGKVLHRVGKEYMTESFKLRWDSKMSEVAGALKEGDYQLSFFRSKPKSRRNSGLKF